MIAAWMLYCLATSALLWTAAVVADHVARRTAVARRAIWLGALIVAAALGVKGLIATLPSANDRAGLASITRSTGGAIAAASVSAATVDGREAFARHGRYDALRDRLTSVAMHLQRFDRACAVVVAASAFAGALYLVMAFFRLRAIERRLEWGELDGYPILVSRNLGPALLGVIAPRIVLPDWATRLPPDDRHLILAHERRHAEAGDPLVLFVANVLIALQPWNLFTWAMRARLQLAVETDCDRRVLTAHRDVRRYAELLITVHERGLPALPSLVAFAERPSNLELRVREMTRRDARTVSAGMLLTGGAAGALMLAACMTPEPTSAPSARAPSAALSSITGGGRCMSASHDVSDLLGDMRALARARRPYIVARNDSTDLIGFVLDENCNVVRDTLATMPPSPKSGYAILHAAFPNVRRDSVKPGGMTFMYGKRRVGRPTFGPTVAFLIRPSASWRARRANDLCGFGARSDELCSVVGSVALRRVDSTRLVIAVRSKPVGDSAAAPTDHYFLVSALRPLPRSVTQRIRFGRVMYQNNAVYVENRATTEPAMVFGANFSRAFGDFRMPRVTYDSLIGIAHYASPGVTLENIDQLHPRGPCDGPVGSCYEVAGKKIEFPD
jgi:beta-lactamase regulating signal transducer with metallopeptidase domain